MGLNLPALSSDHFQMGYNAANAVRAARAIGKGIDKNFGMVCFDDNNLLINLRLNINTEQSPPQEQSYRSYLYYTDN